MHQLRKDGKRFQSLQPLSPAGTLRFGELVQQSLAPSAIFVWLMIWLVLPWRYSMPLVTNIIASLGACAIMFFPTRALFVYVAGVIKTAQNSVARSSAVVFWCYWPCSRFFACVLAIALAVPFGNYLWHNNFQLYAKYYHLQSYNMVDSYTVTGTRIQDAGIVQFNVSDGVDRGRGACIVNGHTYCIAPIVRGGVVKMGEDQSRTGYQDLFMAGIDCCDCPMTDFRCGSWDDPVGHLGGWRNLDEESRKMFQLAADKWAVDWHKNTLHGVFFNWVNNPVVEWMRLWKRGAKLAMLSGVCAVILSFLLMVILNGIMTLLRDFMIAVPLDDIPPALLGTSFARNDEAKPFVTNQYSSYLHPQDFRNVDQAATTFVIL